MKPDHQYQFTEVEEASATLSKVGDLKLTQTAPGALDMSFRSRLIGKSLLYQSKTSHDLVSVGKRSEHFVTISPMTSKTEAGKFRGHTPKSGQILLMDPGGDSFQIIAANQEQIGLSVPLEICNRIAISEYGIDHPEKLWNWNLLEGEPRKINRFLNSLEHLLSNASTRLIHQNIEIQLAETLVGFAAEQVLSNSYDLVPFDKQRIVRKSIEHMMTRLANPPSVLELCELTGSKRRSVFYAFQELLQTTPLQYSKSLRLHEARRHLLTPGHMGVQDIASSLGFSHFGQFAIDYAKVFGESPRQTLTKKR